MSSSDQRRLAAFVRRSRVITEADTGLTVPAIDVKAGEIVMPGSVSLVVLTPFAGGTPSLDVGDEDDPDGYVDSTDITEVTAGTYAGTEANTGSYANTGRYYATAGKIDVVLSAGLTAGKAYVYAIVQDAAVE